MINLSEPDTTEITPTGRVRITFVGAPPIELSRKAALLLARSIYDITEEEAHANH